MGDSTNNEDKDKRNAPKELSSQKSQEVAVSSDRLSKNWKTPSCVTLRDAFGKLFRLDDFTLELVANGFFSDVYKVIHKVTGETMVLKKNTNIRNRPNILREVQLLNSLSHPNILRLMGACIHEGQVHALTEFINGGSLETMLADKERDLSWDHRINFACDIASGMNYLHSKDIMHRDLTSKNVLIQLDGSGLTALICDLGLATKIPKTQGTRLSIVGSPYWMAPECIQGYIYNEKADVFSYGIILCEIIARIEADPDILPRTANFGVDYVVFSKMARDCPIAFLQHAYNCLQIQPEERPPFWKICDNLKIIKRSNTAVVLADITNLKSKPDTAVNKTILEKILIGRGLKRNMSDEAITIQIPELLEIAVLETVDREGHNNTETVRVHFSSRPKPKQHETDGRKVFSVTKETVGQVMSRDDPFYLPHQDNPFCGVFKDCKAKLMGSRREHWAPLIDLHLPVTRDKEMAQAACVPPRRCISLPNSPPRNRKEVDFRTVVNESVLSEGIKHDLSFAEDIDVQSEGASSTDSAVGLEPVSRDPMFIRFSNKYLGLCKFSIDPGVITHSSEKPVRVYRTDLIARQLEARVLDDALQRRFRHNHHDTSTSTVEDCGPCSFSSSESCVSLDENSIMSPTSSYSSYSENDSEMWFTRAQQELYEHRLRSRERFQELVRRWEEKQGRAGGTGAKVTTLSPAAALRPGLSQRPVVTLERSPDVNDPGNDRHFQELRQKFESKQRNSQDSAHNKQPPQK